jgi:hypothetical protein
MLLIKKKNPDLLLFINKLNDHSWMAQSDDQPQEDFARFGHKTSRFLECFQIMLYFCDARTYHLKKNYLTMKFSKKIGTFCEGEWNIFWNIWEHFICQNEIFRMKLFFGRDLVNLKGFYVFLTNILQSKNVKVPRRHPSLE